MMTYKALGGNTVSRADAISKLLLHAGLNPGLVSDSFLLAGNLKELCHATVVKTNPKPKKLVSESEEK